MIGGIALWVYTNTGYWSELNETSSSGSDLTEGPEWAKAQGPPLHKWCSPRRIVSKGHGGRPPVSMLFRKSSIKTAGIPLRDGGGGW